MDAKAVRVRQIIVEGAVQGVGYREFVRRGALGLDVAGWVRNRADGSVEALLQGEAANLDALLAEMGRGPPGSEVSRLLVVEREVNEAGVIGGFIVRQTC
jgi:acylphosphatase